MPIKGAAVLKPILKLYVDPPLRFLRNSNISAYLSRMPIHLYSVAPVVPDINCMLYPAFLKVIPHSLRPLSLLLEDGGTGAYPRGVVGVAHKAAGQVCFLTTSKASTLSAPAGRYLCMVRSGVYVYFSLAVIIRHNLGGGAGRVFLGKCKLFCALAGTRGRERTKRPSRCWVGGE